MNESTSPNMYIKPDYSAQVEQWVAEGNQIKSLANGEGAHSKKFNNRDKSKSPQDAMRRIMSNSIAVDRAQKENPHAKARAEARANGLKRFTGSECKKCGSTQKFVSTNNCVACSGRSAAKSMQKKRAS